MQAEDIDLVDEILGPAVAAVWVEPRPEISESAVPVGVAVVVESGSTSPVGDTVDASPKRRLRLPKRPRLPNPLAWALTGARHHRRAVGFAVGFAVGAAGCLAGLTAVATSVSGTYANRVVPGVHVGAVDLSGLSRDQVISKLQTSYAYLGQGKVTVTTPTGAATITYEELGRAPDVESMADLAMASGHTGNPIGDAIDILRGALNGPAVPVVVRIDPTAVATRVHQLAGNVVPPRDAQAWVQGGTFVDSSSAAGFGLDEAAISSAIVDHLTQPDAPASFQAGGAWVVLEPRVTEADAQAAIASAQKMLVDVKVIFAVSSPASGSSDTTSSTKSYTIKADAIASWIVFDTDDDGRYVPRADPGRMQTYLADLAQQFRIAPVEPTIVFDSTGAPVGVNGGKAGLGIDAAATSRALAAYLDGLAAGQNQVFAIMGATSPISPNLTVDFLRGLVNIGSWTTVFYPDISNGNGANIRTPARLLNGQIVAPGQQFSFLQAVSPVDTAHGYTLGGVIQHGRSDHTGAMGGGICSASTTMFNAAARAGLQIDERHPHYYYIYRYPVGLDATVYSDGHDTWDMKWTNDTPNPIVIVASSTYGSTSTITIQLWSLPTGRTATFSPEFKANVIRASDHTVYTTALPPGQKVRAEYPTDGFDTSRTRTVTDSTGAVIRTDTWKSHYTEVDGLLEIGA